MTAVTRQTKDKNKTVIMRVTPETHGLVCEPGLLNHYSSGVQSTKTNFFDDWCLQGNSRRDLSRDRWQGYDSVPD